MAAAADPRAKTPATPSSHHLKPWVPPPRGSRVPSLLPAVSGASRDRRRSSTSSSHRRGGDASAADEEPYDAGLEDLRAKLMGHLHDAADRLRLPQAHKSHRSPAPAEPKPPLPPPPPAPPQDAAAAVVAAASMPWTLRERKRRPSARGSAAAAAAQATTTAAAGTARDDGERAPFALALEAEEIEEDIYALTGARPRRRPRKRSRIVQRQLDSLFPGLWLTEITADAYRVPDD